MQCSACFEFANVVEIVLNMKTKYFLFIESVERLHKCNFASDMHTTFELQHGLNRTLFTSV